MRKYTAIKNDSLYKIAKKLYGFGPAWRILYLINKDVVGSNPDMIKPGQTLKII